MVDEKVKAMLSSVGIDVDEEKARIRAEMKVDPTRLSPRDELRAEVLLVLSDMFVTITDPYMLLNDKYEILTELDMPKLMSICTGD